MSSSEGEVKEEEETDGMKEKEEEESGSEEESNDEEEEDSDDDNEDDDGEEDDDAAAESSDGEERECCPICLDQLRDQDVGTPESCDHWFCLECLQIWAKNVNTCPVDRQVFHIILARHAGEEKIFKQIHVEDKQKKAEENEEEDDPTYCEVCGQSDREDRLLLCDGCDLGYHCDCLTPPLAQVPVDEWFCPDCQQERDQAEQEQTLPRHLRRQIARTQISERVRRVIQEYRIERFRSRALFEEEDDEEEEDFSETRPSTSAGASSRPTRKYKTTKKKKTPRKKASGSATKKGKTKRKGKTGKRKKKKKILKREKEAAFFTGVSPGATTAGPASSVKGRIADKLGLSRPPKGRTIPLKKGQKASGSTSWQDRTVVNASSFTILGNRNDLSYSFADHDDQEIKAKCRPPVRSARSLCSHKPLSFAPAKRKVVVPEPPKPSVDVPGFDILGSIMQKQELLAKGSKAIVINRDGSLKAAAPIGSISSTSSSLSSPTKHSSPTDKKPSPLPLKDEKLKVDPIDFKGDALSGLCANYSESDESISESKSPVISSKPEEKEEVSPSRKRKLEEMQLDVNLSPKSRRKDREKVSEVEGECCDARSSPSPPPQENGQSNTDPSSKHFVVKLEEQVHDFETSDDVIIKQEPNVDESDYGKVRTPPVDSSGDRQTVVVKEEIILSATDLVVPVVIKKERKKKKDVEEGEASDSDEEGEVMSGDEVKQEAEDEEEGEIVEFEEIKENNGLDAAVVVKTEVKEEVESDIDDDADVNLEDDDEETSEDEIKDVRFRGSYMLGHFLKELKSNEFDRRSKKARLRDEEMQKRVEAQRRKLLTKEERRREDREAELSRKKISIEDFINPQPKTPLAAESSVVSSTLLKPSRESSYSAFETEEHEGQAFGGGNSMRNEARNEWNIRKRRFEEPPREDFRHNSRRFEERYEVDRYEVKRHDVDRHAVDRLKDRHKEKRRRRSRSRDRSNSHRRGIDSSRSRGKRDEDRRRDKHKRRRSDEQSKRRRSRGERSDSSRRRKTTRKESSSSSSSSSSEDSDVELIRPEPQPISLESDSDEVAPLPQPPLPPSTYNYHSSNPPTPPPPPSYEYPPVPPSPPHPPPPSSPPYNEMSYSNSSYPGSSHYSSPPGSNYHSNYPPSNYQQQNYSNYPSQGGPGPSPPPPQQFPTNQFQSANMYPQQESAPYQPPFQPSYPPSDPYTSAAFPPLVKSDTVVDNYSGANFNNSFNSADFNSSYNSGQPTSSFTVKHETNNVQQTEPILVVKQEVPQPQSSAKRDRRSPGPKPRSFAISPPAPTIRGVSTTERLNSNIMLDEVKKGFKTLVEDAVRSALKVPWSAKKISKDEYKDIFKKSVEKVTGSKETVVNPSRIKLLVEAYVTKARKSRQPPPH